MQVSRCRPQVSLKSRKSTDRYKFVLFCTSYIEFLVAGFAGSYLSHNTIRAFLHNLAAEHTVIEFLTSDNWAKVRRPASRQKAH